MTPTVQVHIIGLECFGRHGVYPAERELGQRFVVDVTVDLADCPAAESDELSGTLDYAALAEEVAGIVAGPPVALLEHLAHRIAVCALRSPRAAAATVHVRKPHVALSHPVTATAVTLRLAR